MIESTVAWGWGGEGEEFALNDFIVHSALGQSRQSEAASSPRGKKHTWSTSGECSKAAALYTLWGARYLPFDAADKT